MSTDYSLTPKLIAAHEDQSILVAVNHWPGHHYIPHPEMLAFAGIGEHAVGLFDGKPNAIDPTWDMDQETQNACPKAIGWYVWAGTIEEWDTPDAYEYDEWLVWRGAWRRATVADFGRFGLGIGDTER